ncbi:AAA-like domain-containing protein [Kamptonema sp. UHCC 0994]|uniref:AAA-like domain-containing protein n=1 Tax=Kamptonema sp. UHCC 0994 TaxID=3031329 RepID=UPI0031B9E706
MLKSKRDRGRILTASGLKKINEAIQEWSDHNNLKGTLAEVEAESGVGADTVSKIRQGRDGADLSKIRQLFATFGLTLDPNDHNSSKPDSNQATTEFTVSNDILLPTAEPELPGGQVDVNSRFYVERPPIEERCYETILQSSALIRIKAPRQMGKTSLLSRILDSASGQGYCTVPLSFQLVDKGVFANLDKFLKWFCAYIGRELNLPNQLDDYWDEIFGSKVNCKDYFEKYILPQIDSPLVLGLDEIDRVFQYTDIAEDFLGLLRAWHEESKRREIWKKLRLIVVHSTEVYIPMNINQSPFNVGLPVELPDFNAQQIEDLAQRHDLNWSEQEVLELMAIVGGNPYLIRVALYHIARHDLTLEQLKLTAFGEAGVYSEHLRRQLWNLEQYPELTAGMREVVMASSSVQLKTMQAFKLESLGLVKLQGNECSPRCELYRQYFRLHLSQNL